MDTPDGFLRDQGVAWLATLGGFIASFVAGTIRASNSLLEEALVESYDCEDGVANKLLTLHVVVVGLTGLLSAWLCKYLSYRLVGFLGGVIVFVAFILTAYAGSITMVYVFYGLVAGGGMSLAYTASFLAVDSNFTHMKATAMALASSGAGVGAMIFPPLMAVIRDNFGYKGCLWSLAICSLLLLLTILFYRMPGERILADAQNLHLTFLMKPKEIPLVPSTYENGPTASYESFREIRRRQSDYDSDDLEVCAQPRDSFCETLPDVSLEGSEEPEGELPFWDWRLLQDIEVFFLLVQNVSVQAFTAFTTEYTVPYAIDKGFSNKQAYLLLIAFGLSCIIIPLIIGFIMDYPPIRGYLIYIANFCVGLGGVLQILTPVCDPYGLIIFMFIIKSGLVSIFLTQRATMAGDIGDGHLVAAILGLSLVADALGSLIGRVTGDAFRDAEGSYDAGFYLTGGMCVVGCACLHVALVIYHNRNPNGKTADTSDNEEN